MVPLGEHSDWAGQKCSHKGVTIVCSTNEGLFAKVHQIEKREIVYVHSAKEQSFNFEYNVDSLKEIALRGQFECYVAGTAAALLESAKFKEKYSLDAVPFGIKIENYLTTLPMKKGLSSSAAICVLVVKSFNSLFSLDLCDAEIMDIAYNGEMYTPSRCGRMDQCVVMGVGSIGKMEFKNNSCTLQKLKCSAAIHFVVVNLNSYKDTIVILRDLNDCFPVPKNETQQLMHKYVEKNINITNKTIEAIESGDNVLLSICMKEAQQLFDECAKPNCLSQLTSPLLHGLIEDNKLSEISLAVKGVGSQGDGSAQILCEDADQQHKVLDYLKEQYGYLGFTLTIPVSN